MIILLQHVFLRPLRGLVGDALLGDTLCVIAQLVLFVGLCGLLELQGFGFSFCGSGGLCLLEALQQLLVGGGLHYACALHL